MKLHVVVRLSARRWAVAELAADGEYAVCTAPTARRADAHAVRDELEHTDCRGWSELTLRALDGAPEMGT